MNIPVLVVKGKKKKKSILFFFLCFLRNQCDSLATIANELDEQRTNGLYNHIKNCNILLVGKFKSESRGMLT